MPQIIIDEKRCTGCNTCASVCVMGIIEKSKINKLPKIKEDSTGFCIKCGHCESYCAQKALTLDFLIEEKIDISAHDVQIEPETLALYIKKRRSVRQFTSEPVSKELIFRVMEVARYAASGGNSQPVKWLVIYDTSEVKRISELTVDWMRKIRKSSHPLANYVAPIIAMWNRGKDLICYNAPHLLFAHIPANEPFTDPTEAVISMTHFDIAAPSFGIGTCWAGFVKLATDDYKPLQDALGLPEGRKAVCAMMFGHSSYEVASIPRRNPLDITWR